MVLILKSKNFQQQQQKHNYTVIQRKFPLYQNKVLRACRFLFSMLGTYPQSFIYIKLFRECENYQFSVSNILSVRPIFYRSGIKPPKIIGNFLSVSRTDKFKKMSVRPNICRSRTDGFHIL